MFRTVILIDAKADPSLIHLHNDCAMSFVPISTTSFAEKRL